MHLEINIYCVCLWQWVLSRVGPKKSIDLVVWSNLGMFCPLA